MRFKDILKIATDLNFTNRLIFISSRPFLTITHF